MNKNGEQHDDSRIGRGHSFRCDDWGKATNLLVGQVELRQSLDPATSGRGKSVNTVSTRRGFLGRLVRGMATLFGMLHAPLVYAQDIAAGLSRIKGKIIRRGDSNYESWRASMVWYLIKPRRYPDLIVRAQSEQDVIEAINYARENKLKVSVRATGHNPARAVLRSGGMLIDLSQLRQVEIDAHDRTAWIQPGIRSEEFIDLTRQQGMAFPAAHTGSVGLGGYLIGGGVGWNIPEWDVACRSILEAEIITADGRQVLASANENDDLLWAVRGAGPGFFGAVVRYKLKLFPLPRAITESKYLIPVGKLPAVIDALDDLVAVKGERLEVLAVIGRFAPPEQPPGQRELQCAVSLVAFANTQDEARSLLAPVDDGPLASMSFIKQERVPMTYPELYVEQSTNDHSSPKLTTVENIWTDEPGKVLSILAKRLQEGPPPSPHSFAVSLWGINPAKQDAASCLYSAADHWVSWFLMADEEAHVEQNYAWMDAAVEVTQPFARSRYINEIDPRRYPHHVSECFTDASWRRLGALRQKYDPGEVFHSYLGHA